MDVDLVVTELQGEEPGTVAEDVESLGYNGIWLTELWGESSFVQLTEMAAATDELLLGTAIVNVYGRTPATLAMNATALDRVSDGRFILGTGVSTKKVIEDLHGMSFDRPVRRAHETLELFSAFTSGEGRVNYDGELISVADFPAQDADVPVYHAGLGPANRRVVGRLADGWLPHNIPLSKLNDSFEMVEKAAKERDREPEEITVAPYLPTAASEDRENARDTLRRHIAYYVSSGEGYRKAASMSFEEEVDRVNEQWKQGNRGEAAAEVTEAMIDDLGIAGTPEEVRGRLRELTEETVTDRPIVVIPDPASDELRDETIESVAPEKF